MLNNYKLNFKQRILQRLLPWIRWTALTSAHSPASLFGQKSAPFLGCDLVILSRGDYREFTRLYPIQSRSELIQVLNDEYNQQSETVFHLIDSEKDHNRRVTSYVCRSDVIKSSGILSLVIPETLALSYVFAEPAAVKITSAEGSYFLGKYGGQLKTQHQSKLCQSIEQFKVFAGLPDEIETAEIDQESLPALLRKGLETMPWHKMLAFIRLNRAGDRPAMNWRPVLLGTVIAGMSYLALSSAYLSFTQEQRVQELAALGSDVNELLDRQSRFEQYQIVSEELNRQFANNMETSQIWFMLTPLIQDAEVEVQGVTLVDNNLIVRGKAPRAIVILEMVANSPYFTAVKFDAPVSRSDNREFFVISAQLTAGKETADGQ